MDAQKKMMDASSGKKSRCNLVLFVGRLPYINHHPGKENIYHHLLQVARLPADTFVPKRVANERI